MKTPTNLNGNNLALFLQSASELRMADLYTITLTNGTVLRYTTWDTNLVVSGNSFLTGPPNVKRSHIEEKTGLDVSAIDLEISASTSDLLVGPNIPILQGIAIGMFDGAAVRIDRLFMDPSRNQIGTVIRFSGFLGEVDEVGRSYAKLSVHAMTELLTQQLPNIIMQPNCTNTLFDARCGIPKTNLFLQSDHLENAAWSKTNVTVTPGAITAPDGTLTGCKVGVTASAAAVISQGVASAGNGLIGNMYSIYVQQGSGPNDGNKFVLRNDTTATNLLFVTVDYSSGAITYNTRNDLSSVATMTNVGNGWWRLSMFAIVGISAGNTIRCYAGFPGNTETAGEFFYSGGTQLEVGSYATPYNRTTTVGASFFEVNTVQAGSTANKLISVSAKADGYYDNGQIVFTSGANNGITKAVKQYLSKQFTFNSPLPFVPSAGDTFTSYPGCDKMQSTCTNKFSNLANFEGFPYVPVPETAI